MRLLYILKYLTTIFVCLLTWSAQYLILQEGGDEKCVANQEEAKECRELLGWRALKYGIPEWLKIPPLRA
jgi:hypothetical protein